MIGKNLKGFVCLFLILAVVWLSGCISTVTVQPINSTNWTVCPSGCDYTTITACLDAVNNTGQTCVLDANNQAYTINGSYYYNIQDPEGDGAVRINASNVIMDCNNSIIWGGPIAAGNQTNITVRNCEMITDPITKNLSGIFFDNVTYSQILNNSMSLNSSIQLRHSNNSRVANNKNYNKVPFNLVSSTSIIASYSSNATIENNAMFDSSGPFLGIILDYSPNSIVRNNSFSDNFGIFLSGISVTNSNNTRIYRNKFTENKAVVGGISIGSGSHNTLAYENNFSNSGAVSFMVLGGGDHPSNVTIRNNTMRYDNRSFISQHPDTVATLLGMLPSPYKIDLYSGDITGVSASFPATLNWLGSGSNGCINCSFIENSIHFENFILPVASLSDHLNMTDNGLVFAFSAVLAYDSDNVNISKNNISFVNTSIALRAGNYPAYLASNSPRNWNGVDWSDTPSGDNTGFVVATSLFSNSLVVADNMPVFLDGSENLSMALFAAGGLGNATLLFPSSFASNCDEIETFLAASGANGTCDYFESDVWLANGPDQNYTLNFNGSTTVVSGFTDPPSLNWSVAPPSGNITVNDNSIKIAAGVIGSMDSDNVIIGDNRILIQNSGVIIDLNSNSFTDVSRNNITGSGIAGIFVSKDSEHENSNITIMRNNITMADSGMVIRAVANTSSSLINDTINGIFFATIFANQTGNYIIKDNALQISGNSITFNAIANETEFNGSVFINTHISGIILDSMKNSTVQNNTISMNQNGLSFLSHSSNFTRIEFANITDNVVSIISLINSENNSIINNTAQNSSPLKINVTVPSSNAVQNNTVNITTVSMYIVNSSWNNLTGNTFNNNSASPLHTILYMFNHFLNNTVFSNPNMDDIHIVNSSNNSIWLNNFFNRGVWDDGNVAGWYASLSPIYYNGENFTSTYLFGDFDEDDVITADNQQLVNTTNWTGKVNFTLVLTDESGSNSTYLVSKYVLDNNGIYNCSDFDSVVCSGTPCCYLFLEDFLVADGHADYKVNPAYTFNSSFRVADGYSSPPKLEYKVTGYSGSNNYCVNGNGNFYEEKFEPVYADCGPANLTAPLYGSYNLPDGKLNVSWTRQSSGRTVTYDVYLQNMETGITTFMGSTVGLNLTLFMPASGNYTIRLVPWVQGSRINGTNDLSENFYVFLVPHFLKISQAVINSQFFMTLTKGDWMTIRNRIPLIEAGQFLTKIAPTFAYGLGVYYPITVMLKYSDIDLEGSINLQKGAHTLVIENNGTVGGRPVILISGT